MEPELKPLLRSIEALTASTDRQHIQGKTRKRRVNCLPGMVESLEEVALDLKQESMFARTSDSSLVPLVTSAET